MSKLAKVVTTAVAAALLAASPAFPALASAHPAHPTAHAKKHAVHDKLAGPRRGAANAVAAQLKAVKRLVSDAGELTLADGANLGVALAADQAAVQSDLSAVSTATSVKSLRSLVAAAGNTRQIARMQFQVVVAADAIGVQATTLGATVTDLVTKLSDPTVVDPAVIDPAPGLLATDDATAQLATATNGVTNVVTAILAVSPTATRAQAHAANDSAQAALLTISTALAAVNTDITTVQTAYSL